MARTVLGAVIGLLVAFFTIMLVEIVSHQAYPPPPGIDPGNTADMARLIGMLPTGALLSVVGAWVIGAFDGGFVAALIARNQWPRVAALVPALMVMAGVVAMMVTMPAHPKWMAICGLVLPIPAALAGAWLATRGRHPTR